MQVDVTAVRGITDDQIWELEEALYPTVILNRDVKPEDESYEGGVEDGTGMKREERTRTRPWTKTTTTTMSGPRIDHLWTPASLFFVSMFQVHPIPKERTALRTRAIIA